MSALPVIHGDGSKLPTVEEFAAFLYRRGDSSMDNAKRRLLVAFATERSCQLNENTWAAIADAHRVADEATLTADEMEAEHGNR